MQLVVVNTARHGAELGGHVPGLNFDLGFIPSFHFVTRMQIQYKYMGLESALNNFLRCLNSDAPA